MSLNWSVLFLFSALVNGGIGILFLALHRQEYQPKRRSYWLIALTVGMLLIYVEQMMRFSGLYKAFPISLFLSSPCYFFLYPLLLSFQRNKSILRRDGWVHFIIPFLMLLVLLPSILMNGTEKLAMFHTKDLTDPPWLIVFFVAYAIYYSILILKTNKHYSQQLYNELSNSDLRFQVISNQLVFLFCLLYLLIPLALSVQYWGVNAQSHKILGQWIFTAFSFSAHLMLLIILRQFKTKVAPFKAKVEERIEPIANPDLSEAKTALRKHIIQTSVFKNQELTLPDLAGEMNWSRSKLSMVINQGFQKNFYDFINQFRLDFALAEFKKGAHIHYSLDHIASQSGFRNYVSFYRFFKKQLKQSPKAFLKDLSIPI